MITIDSITAFHRLRGLPEPTHPLISLFRVEDLKFADNPIWEQYALNFYAISLKRGITSKVKYGQQYYDFDKGLMTFVAARQVQTLEVPESGLQEADFGKGYALLVHVDFLHGHPLAASIRNYSFFSYAINEALHLSEKEEENVADIFKKISEEIRHIDTHTQEIVCSQIDLLLNYSKRFYERQFITRKAVHHDLLTRTESILNNYFGEADALRKGLPTVEYLAGQLHISPHYLSDMLRSLTGRSAQQHIHDRLVEQAKEYLSTTSLSVAEIAYQLGFDYPQSFNKLFKKKTNVSPLAFRRSFN
jgi:AraC-like DNA-binding protein